MTLATVSSSDSSSTQENRRQRKEQRLTGIPASPGIVIGTIYLFSPSHHPSRSTTIREEQIEEEIRRFEDARQKCVAQLHSIIEQSQKNSSAAVPFLEAQIPFLEDPEILDEIIHLIYKQKSAEAAVTHVFSRILQKLKKHPDPIIRDRIVEIEDVQNRLLKNLLNEKQNAQIPSGSIVVASSLTLSDILFFDEQKIGGIALENSNATSHPVLLARSLSIPLITGLTGITKVAKTGQTAILDAASGIFIINPSERTLKRYYNKSVLREKRNKLHQYLFLPSYTKDRKKISIYATVNSPSDIEPSTFSAFDGIGLIRTELLLPTFQINSDLREILEKQYTEIAQRCYPKPVTFRLFDFGADKLPEEIEAFRESHSALGLRGIRYLLQNKKVLEIQLDAILKAAVHRNVRILLPLVTTVDDFTRFVSILQRKAKKQNSSFSHVPIGIMVETPAAALLIEKFAPLVQFFSIGTNDLTQFTLAVDRSNATVAQYYDPLHPSVLKLIDRCVTVAKAFNIEVSVCGEIAGDPLATELLLGLGISTLTIHHTSLGAIKKQVQRIEMEKAIKLAKTVIDMSSAEEVRSFLKKTRTKG